MAIAADAEEQLLREAVVRAAAVEAVGDRPLGRLVGLDVAVEQQERDAPDERLPDLCLQHPVGTDDDADVHGRPVGVAQQRQR